MIADVHAHLDHPLFYGKLDEIIGNAEKAGVKAIITNGINPSTNRKSLALAAKYDIVKCALGIYPPDALRTEAEDASYPPDADETNIEKELKFIEDNKDKIIAIGEAGLDYYNGKDKEKQESVFSKLIRLAKKIDKPLIVHSRKAESDVIGMLEEKKAEKIILHCFCGKKKLVQRAAGNGWSFSVPPSIVRAENFQILVSEVPLSQILTETDAPYLSPYRDKLNEPAFIQETIKKIAEIKEMTEEEVENIIFMNYQKLF